MLLIYAAAVFATSVHKREVPQEHSHDLILDQVRPLIQKSGTAFAKIDPVFGTLANAAATTAINSNGLKGDDADVACLQQNLADACITGAAGNKNGIIACVQFRALERNTAKIGQASDTCTKQPKSKELAGLKQHQDPAGNGAAQNNKDVEIQVAKVAKSLGFSDQEAVNFAQRTSTFQAAGNDPSGRGNTCDFDPGNPVNQSPIVATKDGTVFGLAVKKGQKVDCGIVATLEGNKSKLVPAASDKDILAAIGGGNIAQTGNNQGNQNNNKGKQNNGGQKVTTVTVTVNSCPTPAAVQKNNNQQNNQGNGGSLPTCKGQLDGTLCTTSGAGKVGNKQDIVNLCNSCAARARSKGVNADGKLKDCLAKVNGGDRNPVMPLNTFGRDLCPQ